MNIIALETAYGKIYIPDTDDCQYLWLTVTGRSHEDRYINEVCGLLDERPIGVAIDAGANFGTWTLPLARHAKRVIAYEAQPDVCEMLYRTCCHNNVGDKISICNRAVWSRRTMLEVPSFDTSLQSTFQSFGGVMVRPPGVTGGYVQPIQAVALDDEKIAGPVSFIKIDVEGSESEVLRGAADLIGRDKPIMFVEVVHPDTDTDGLIKQIKDLGYGVAQRGNTPSNVLAMPI